jgi:hypothetical protein
MREKSPIGTRTLIADLSLAGKDIIPTILNPPVAGESTSLVLLTGYLPACN